MADNTVLSPGAGGDTLRDIDKGPGVKTQVVAIDLGGAGAESLLTGTLPVSAATLPLPAGAATESTQLLQATAAKQDTGNTSLSSIDGKLPALGQALAASSVPVILPAATVTTLTPPAAISGFALEAGHLAAIDTATAKIPSQGQALAAGSMPVVLTAIQQTALTPPAAITGFALETGHLATIDTSVAKIPSQGTALTAASLPVNIASDQTVPVSNASLTTIAGAIKTEDAASADGDAGIQSLGVRQDIPDVSTSLSGDYTPLKTDNKGRLWVTSDLLEAVLRANNDTLLAILTEMRLHTHILQTGLNVRDDMDSLRQDAYFNASLQ